MSNVPQGSALDPVRCLIYLNDITNSINSNIRHLVDDSIQCRDIQISEDYDTLPKYLNKLFECQLANERLYPKMSPPQNYPKRRSLAISPTPSQTKQSPELNHTLISTPQYTQNNNGQIKSTPFHCNVLEDFASSNSLSTLQHLKLK